MIQVEILETEQTKEEFKRQQMKQLEGLLSIVASILAEEYIRECQTGKINENGNEGPSQDKTG